MDAGTLSILRDPVTHEPLKHVVETVAGGGRVEALVNEASGTRYPVIDGIPVFVSDGDVTGLNRKFRRLYDRFAFLYDPALAFFTRLFKHVGDVELRRQYLERFLGKDGFLYIDDNTRILEVSVGTGHNILALPARGRYYGLDLSRGMLMRCRRNMRKYGRSIELFQGNAEYLPFTDSTFDIVFHVGGINFFNDKAKAIAEMVRVARPGTRIAIADESEKMLKRASALPIIGRKYRGQEGMAAPPIGLVPENMQDVKVDYILDGEAYVLHFTKPLRNF